MISSNYKEHKGLILKGRLSEIEAETIIILSEIYKKNRELYGETIAKGILTNMVTKAVIPEANWININEKEEEALAYTE